MREPVGWALPPSSVRPRAWPARRRCTCARAAASSRNIESPEQTAVTLRPAGWREVADAESRPGSACRRVQEVLRDRRPVAAQDAPLQDGTGWRALDGDVVEPADIEL